MIGWRPGLRASRAAFPGKIKWRGSGCPSVECSCTEHRRSNRCIVGSSLLRAARQGDGRRLRVCRPDLSLLGLSLEARLRDRAPYAGSRSPYLGKKIPVAVLREEQLCPLLNRAALNRISQDYGCRPPVRAPDKHGLRAARRDVFDRIFARRERLVSGDEIERNIHDHLLRSLRERRPCRNGYQKTEHNKRS